MRVICEHRPKNVICDSQLLKCMKCFYERSDVYYCTCDGRAAGGGAGRAVRARRRAARRT